jgi:hypothetical protein
MADQGADFGFVGGAYEAPDLLQDAQRLINWYVEYDPSINAKEPIALLGTPGLAPLFSCFISSGANVRGAWVLPGNTQMLVACGNVVSLVTVTTAATQASLPQFTVTQVGFLQTNNGRVVIRDNGTLFNGLGGYAVLVDGQYGYFYQLSGTTRVVTFGGNVTIGSPTITFPVGVTVPNYLIVSAGPITDSAGAIPATTIQSISFTANTITLNANAGANATADTFSLTIPMFGQILDPAFLAASRVVFTEGWLGFNQVGTRTFFTNAPQPYTMTFAGAFYALKDSSTDNLITMMENNREWWEIGERTSEVWYNAGGANFAWSRLPGIGPQIGCSAQHSIARVGNNLAWLARIGEAGENVVILTEQYGWRRVSTHAIEHAISSYPLVSDAIGDCYEEEGHLIYQLTFPTADVTWCLDVTVYDLSQGKLGWFQRLSWDPDKAVYHRHRANCMANFADVLMVGDYITGQFHQQSRQIYTEVNNIGVQGAPLRCQRRTPHIWDKGKRQRLFAASMQIEFTPGVGLQFGQGSSPQVMIRWSNDGGFTWSNEHWVTIGSAGQTKNRALLRRLGQFRDRVWEANFSDPVARDIIGATMFGEAEEDAA